nr:mitochondrial substrate carrier family protein C [Ipomoea batatas]
MLMVSGNGDAADSFRNSMEVVRGVLSPIESSIKKVAKDLEHCWPGSQVVVVDSSDDSKNSELNLNRKSVVTDVEKTSLAVKVPTKKFVGFFGSSWQSDRDEIGARKGLKEKYGGGDVGKSNGNCFDCLHFALAWSLMMNNFAQALPGTFKVGTRWVHKTSNGDAVPNETAMKPRVLGEFKKKESNGRVSCCERLNHEEGNNVSVDGFIGFMFDQLAQNLQKLDSHFHEKESKLADLEPVPPATNQFDHFKVLISVFEGKRADFNGFLGNLNFARVGGMPPSIVGISSPVSDERDDAVNGDGPRIESAGSSPQKLANGLLSIPLSNVERLRSTLSSVSLTELVELLPQLGRPSQDHPDKKKLFSVQDFFRYTEAEGRRFFEELDGDGDGQVTLEDLEVAMRKRKLPKRYAHEFMRRTRSHLFKKSFGWKQFLSLMEQKEPTILRAYTSLCLSKSGTLQKSEILASLKNAGLPAYEDNAVAMMRFLNADTEESISYGHFRNFMLLLPSDRLQEDPRNIWFEAATVVAVAPPVEIPAGSVLKSALAGGLACALSTSLMHPIDTIKTTLQASSLSFPQIMSKLPEIGVRGLYRGSIPAIVGQFSSHGLRTGIFEASKLVLINFAPTLPELQVQSIASFCSTVLGTAVRIPCEVLKQRLQAGLFDNVGQAILGTWQQDGLKGFFRGTGATLCREVPFYVAGMALYAKSKKVAQQLLERELEPWETIAVGALSGGLSAVVTTPFDVIKTRMMTAPQGRPVTLTVLAFSIIHHEGPMGLLKGALPRFFWIAPLGAMNFAGYELAKKAMDKSEETSEQVSLKK